MSYILDALKKSDKERQRGSVPDVMTAQETAGSSPRRRSPLLYLVLVALLLNAGILAVWLYPAKPDKQSAELESGSSQQQMTVMQSEKANTGTAALEPGQAALPVAADKDSSTITKAREHKAEDNPAEKVSTTSSAKDHEGKTSSAVDGAAGLPRNKNRKVLSLNEVPQSVRDLLPDMSSFAHVYSVDPALRMVSINGQVVREGQVLGNEVKLEEIKPDGVVFSYRDYRFQVGL